MSDTTNGKLIPVTATHLNVTAVGSLLAAFAGLVATNQTIFLPAVKEAAREIVKEELTVHASMVHPGSVPRERWQEVLDHLKIIDQRLREVEKAVK